jgi:hypothetical protein
MNVSEWRCLAVRLGLTAFVALGAVLLLRRISFQLHQDPRADGASTADRVFSAVVPLLPAAGRVGYLETGFLRSNAADLAAFFQAQYALAPRILVAGTAPDVVIAVARKGGPLPSVPAGFVSEGTFAGDIALFRRISAAD